MSGYIVIQYKFLFFFKQKTAYEIKECDWSSDVCSSDLKKKDLEVTNNNLDEIENQAEKNEEHFVDKNSQIDRKSVV